MKLKFKDFAKDGSGSIGLIPEEAEDMWHSYNLIAKGDHVRATTFRRVQTETATGSSSSEKVRVTLTLLVESVEFDSQGGLLRISGKNVSESKYVKLGAYHTLDLETNREFVLTKSEWDSIALDRIEMATNPMQFADVGAVVMAEGLAHVCLITPTMTILRQRIDTSIPRKRKGSVTTHEKGLTRFFDTVMQAIQKHFNFNVIKCVIIASPGFVKDQFFEYMMLEAVRQDIKSLMENKTKFILVHSSSGHKHALNEVLMDPQVSTQLSETKASGEVKALNDFYTMLKNEPDRAVYGIKHVEQAAEALAIQTLMITDELFRSVDISTRKRYVKLVDDAKDAGSEVKIFSSMHVSGEQLGQLCGVAAILRFPLLDLDEDEEDEEEDDDDGEDKRSRKDEEKEKFTNGTKS